MVRRGIITSTGGKKHDKLVASLVKFLINICDASPLDIETEKKVKIPKGNVYIDVFWKGRYIECVASKSGLDQRKTEELLNMNLPLILAFSSDVYMKSISERIIPKIKCVLLFDINKQKLLKAFSNLDEFLGYMLAINSVKTIDINL